MIEFDPLAETFTFTDKAGVQIIGQTESWVLKNYPETGAKIIQTQRTAREKLEKRDAVRTKIAKEVGDTNSILGTTADVTQLNAAAILALISAFGAGDTFPKFRAAFMSTIEGLVPTAAGVDVYGQAGEFLAGIQSGDIVLSAALKGLPDVMADLAARSTGVAAILAKAAET